MISTILVDFARVVLLPLNPELPSMGVLYSQISSEEFFNHFKLNHELLNKLKTLKQQDIKIIMYTNSDFYEDEHIKQDLDQVFDKIVSADELGLSKSEVADFKQLLEILNIQPDQTIFIDDKQKNIQAAQAAGIRVIQHTSNSKTLAELKQL